MLSDTFNPRNLKRFGLDFVRGKGHEVICLDVSDIVHPKVDRDRSDYSRLRSTMEVIHVKDIDSLNGLVDMASNSDLIMNFAESGILTKRHWPIMRFIAKTGVPYLVQFSNAYPGHKRYKDIGGILDRIRDFWRRISEFDPIDSCLSRLPRQILGIPAPSFVIYGGQCCEGYSRFVDGSTKRVFAHAMDYDEYRRVKSGTFKLANTAVFLDEFLPYHPDITMMGLKAPMDAGPYFVALRGLFERIEKELGLAVVIAACPHSDYEERPGIFGGRRIEKYRTADLVSESRLVIAHRSTAINYAVLFRKPLMLTATRSTYRHSSQTPYFDGLSIALQKSIQFFDDPAEINLCNPYEVDNAIYDRYIRDYIKKPNSPNMSYWEIVADGINGSGITKI